MSARFIIGDTRKVLATLPDASVDLIFTSPPFLALRSYLPADHADKAAEIGSESSPGEFIDVLLDVVEACSRVLAPHGSLVFELGDTYSGSGGAGGDYNEGGLRDSQQAFSGSAAKRARLGVGDDYRPARGLADPDGRTSRRADIEAGLTNPRSRPGPEGRDNVAGWPLAKSLTLIPESFRWALAYGRNPFTGRETERWRVRNVVRWCRPNPPVGALGDKFRPGTSDLAVCCKSTTRWFDLDAVRVPGSTNAHPRTAQGVDVQESTGKHADDERRGGNWSTLDTQHLNATAPPLDWWEISTQPYSGSHYATFPERLVTRPVESMCPREVCVECGEPRRRITETQRVRISDGTVNPERVAPTRDDATDGTTAIGIRHAVESRSVTLGWTDCGHGNYRRGVVLDPFAGSGTTLAVSEGLGRDSIGIDLDARNADLASDRVGMFLTVETLTPDPT